MRRPHSSTLVRMFDAPSHARCTPPSWATESSPYSTNTRSNSCSARCAPASPVAPPAAGGLEPPRAQELVEEQAAKRFGRARIAREERAFHDLRQVHEREHRAVEVGEVGSERGSLLA